MRTTTLACLPLLLPLFTSACASERAAARPDASASAPRAGSAPAPASARPAFAGERGWSFEEHAPGAPPPGWRVEATHPGASPASWAVVDAPAAHGGRHALALVDPRGARGQTYNLCWTDEVLFLNGRLEVAVRAAAGAEDQGGGPAWRVRGADDYYVARWNPLEGNFRVYSVAGGARTTLDSAEVRADPRAWHTIGIRHEGALIVCSFDGQELLRVSDTAHLAPGGVGLWTKADAATAFDDLVLANP